MKKNIKIIISISVIILVLVIMCYYINKYFIISKIAQKLDELNNVDNYMIETDNGTVYRKGDKYLIGKSNSKIYIDNLTHTSYFVDEEEKKYSIIDNTASYSGDITDLFDEKMTVKNRIKASFSWKIKNDVIQNDKKCFHIYKDNKEFWIDKESFYLVREKDGQDINNVYIKVNCVTDTMINPNLEDYTLEDKKQN